MSEKETFNDIEKFLKKNPAVLGLLKDQEKREAFARVCKEAYDRVDYLIQTPWVNIDNLLRVADGILNISPEISGDELLNILCKETASVTNAKSATCRTYDPSKNCMVAAGSYNWNVERAGEIPYEDSIAGHVIKTKTHYCVPDLEFESKYREKEKLLSMGINSMLALPIELIDYQGTEKREILIGTLQIYFRDKNKTFYPQQIRLIKSIVARFSYVLAQKTKLELEKRTKIIQESRKALISILKHTQSLDQVLNFLVTKIAETIRVNRCSLFTIEGHRRKFAVLVAGYPLSAHSYGITLSFKNHPAFKEVYGTGQPLLIEDAIYDPRMKANYELYLNKKIENVYFVPLKDENGVVTNVLVLDGDESRPLEKDDMFFCNSLVQDVELCIQVSVYSQQRHDFLNQILSFGAIAKIYSKKLASPKTTPEEIDRLYKKLSKSMHAVDDIITDCVPFAQKEKFDLIEVVFERLDAFHFSPDIVIEKHITENKIVISADKKKVGRIAGNLLDNAHKKLEELQKGVLKISLFTEDGYAVIQIGNTGHIPHDIREKISQENAPIPMLNREGAIGISIVKLFTLIHNGTFSFESSPGKNWTVFTAMLPLE